MSARSSSRLHSNITSLPLDLFCIMTTPSSTIYAAFNITCILLLLPLCILVLHHGLQQWRQKTSTSSAVTVSHSDVFTYHMVTMELLHVFGCSFSCCGYYMNQNHDFILVGFYLFTFTWFGELLFHNLTSVERYLAVVHPIIYLSLKTERGIRIRNISIGCIWLLSFTGMGVVHMGHIFIFVDCVVLFLSLAVILFCSLSVLCALIHPGPGERGGDRERVNKSKLRAFYTITVILGALLLRFVGNLTWVILYMMQKYEDCVLMTSEYWFSLPCILVLPLLFLHRAGRLESCKKNNQQE